MGGHAPVLEEDIALGNLALDLIGQSRSFYRYAGEIEGKGRDEDALAYLRDAGGYRNVLLVEQPNGDFAQTMFGTCCIPPTRIRISTRSRAARTRRSPRLPPRR